MINQTKLLKAILRPQFLRENYSYLSLDLFDDPIEKIVSVAILFYFEKYKELPPREDIETILYSKFKDKEEIALIQRKLSELYSPEDLQGLSFLSEQVREFVGKKRLRDLCIQIEENISDGCDLDAIIQDIYKSVSRLSKSSNTALSLLKEDAFSIWKDYKENINKYRIPTGYKLLDKKLDGGIGIGELFLVVVGAKGGKTTFMINLAANMIEQGFDGVYITLELSHLKIYERFLKRLGKLTTIELNDLVLPQVTVDNILKRYSNYGRLEIIKFPSLGATVLDFENIIMKLDFKPSFLVVDYLAEIKPSQSFSQRRDALANNGRELRSLGDRLGFPSITAQQGNRESKKIMAFSSEEDGKRLLSGAISIAECYELTGIADSVFTLNQDDEDFDQGMMRGWLSESRVGESKGKPILFTADYDKQLIAEVMDIFTVRREDKPQEETITL